jgi:hypothetical protein
MSLVIATLVSTVIAAGIPANVVVRQNPNIPNLPNMPSELAGLLDGVNIPADMAGLLGATNVAGLAGLLNAEDMQHVSEALQWAGDSERMFNDPRYQSLQSIVLSPEFSTMNEQEMRSVNQAIGSIAAEYHSNNPAWRTRSDWGDDDDDNDDDDDDTRTFNPAMVATGAGSRTTGASRNDDDDDDDTRTFNPTVVATATGSSTTGSPRSDDDDDDDDDDVNEKDNSQSVAVSGPGSAPAASATGAASSAGQAGSTAASAASSAASAASSAATSATAAVGSAADSAAASATAAVGSATDSAAASATGNVGVSNGVPMAGAAIVFVAALL